MTDSAANTRILVVDDEVGFRSLLHWRLHRQKQRWEVVTAANGHEAAALIRQEHFQLVITDLTMPLRGGLDLLKDIKTASPSTAVIIITGFATIEVAVYAMRHGACDVLLKPFNLHQLFKSIRHALQTPVSSP